MKKSDLKMIADISKRYMCVVIVVDTDIIYFAGVKISKDKFANMELNNVRIIYVNK